jgi:hypothetical protein
VRSLHTHTGEQVIRVAMVSPAMVWRVAMVPPAVEWRNATRVKVSGF